MIYTERNIAAYKYKKHNIVAKLVAKFAPAAIIVVLTPDKMLIISTNIIEKTVLKNCSRVCEFAVTFKFSLPLKYPLITHEIDTKNIDGESATSVNSASGICKTFCAINFAPKNRIVLDKNPSVPKLINAILKIWCAPLWSPIATFSEINFETAFGTPIEEIVKNRA